ncbi:hypothetical protein HMI54_003633 [Coelomomyces lativittatus]|nr:hypothetical protein HMI54_003633 [Coelomomyces lativittatus]
MNTEISVPIPETLINGDVVISWSYIPSQEQQMYGDCFDAKITGSTSREFVGKPMVVANFGSLIDNLRVYAKGRGADHLWKNASPLILKLNSQNQMTLSPSEFSPTRIFKKNDPLLKYFQEPINPNNLNKNPSPVILNSQQIKSNTGEVSNTATYNNPHPAKPTAIQQPIETTTQTTGIQNNPIFPRTGRSLSQNEAQNFPQTDKKPLSQPALEQIPSSITSRSTAADVPATNDPPINSAIGSTEGISPALTPALNTGGCQCPYSCSSHS